MPGIADMIFQQGANTVSETGSSLDPAGLTRGAQLAETVQTIQKQKADMEIAQQNLQLAKIQHYVNAAEVAGKLPEGAAQNEYLKNRLPAISQMLGIDKIIPQQNQSMIAKDPTFVSFMKEQVNNQVLKPEDAISTLADPDKLTQTMAGDEYKRFLAKQKLGEKGDISGALQAVQRQSAPEQPDYEKISRAKNLISEGLQSNGMEGGFSYRDLSDPASRKPILDRLGLDEDTFQQVQSIYPKTLGEAAGKGIADKRAILTAQARSGAAYQRNANQVNEDAQHIINNNPIITNFSQRVYGANRISNLIDNAMDETLPLNQRVKRTKQLMNSVALEEAALVSGKNNTAEGSAERALYESKIGELDDMKDYFSGLFTKDGNVTDVKQFNSALKNAKVQAQQLKQDYATAIGSQLDLLSAGALPEQKRVFDEKKAAYKKQFGIGDSPTAQTYKLPNGKSYTPDQIKTMVTNNPALKGQIDPKILKAAGVQ